MHRRGKALTATIRSVSAVEIWTRIGSMTGFFALLVISVPLQILVAMRRSRGSVSRAQLPCNGRDRLRVQGHERLVRPLVVDSLINDR